MAQPDKSRPAVAQVIAGGCFDSLPEHNFSREPGFPYWTLGGVLTGTRHMYSQHLREPITRDDEVFALTQPDTPYRTYCKDGMKESIFVIFSPGALLLPWLSWPQDAPGMHSLRISDYAARVKFHGMLKAVIDDLRSNHPAKRELCAARMLSALIMASAFNPERQAQPRQVTDARLQRIIQAVHDDPARSWTLTELARLGSMSESSVSHLFKAQTGQSPMRYAERQRIERAKEFLLESDATVGQISDRLGYANPYHFSARFSAVTGVSPSRFRRDPTAG